MASDADQLTCVTRLLDEVLGATLLGAYVYGSATRAGLRPASDLDVLAVTTGSLEERQRQRLVAEVGAVSDPARNARPVELLVVVASEVRPWRYPPRADFLYGEWLRADFERGLLPWPALMPDLALLLSMARAEGHALRGPPPDRLLPEVPLADVVRASVAGLGELLDGLDHDTRNVVLTLARVWNTVATGEIRGKDEAAGWALPRLPAEYRPILAHARDLYLAATYEQESWSAQLRARLRPFALHMVTEISRAKERCDRGEGPV